jgi:hypothetical protein
MTQANNDLPFAEKCRLFLLLAHRIMVYCKVTKLDTLVKLIEPIFTEELRLSFLQMSLYYLLLGI